MFVIQVIVVFVITGGRHLCLLLQEVDIAVFVITGGRHSCVCYYRW